MIRDVFVAVVLALALMGIRLAPANANDSVAEMRPGGLVFVTTDVVAMISEELFISLDEVRVDYVFRNTGEKPETVTVAFPMPVVQGNPWEVPAIPDPDSSNFLAFQVTVNGKAVTPNLQQRAEVAGIDVTEVLKASGLPLEPFAENTIAAVEAMSVEARRALIRRGLLVVDTFDDGTGLKEHPRPYWTVRTTYHWEMTFPPGEDTLVSHRYTPSVGATAGLGFVENGQFQGETYEDYVSRYCIDDQFLAALTKKFAEAPGGAGDFEERRIAYVLTTGRNWAGPIRAFRLTVDKKRPENLVSFCGKGVERTGPTTFTLTREDFSPERDLDILIVTPRQ